MFTKDKERIVGRRRDIYDLLVERDGLVCGICKQSIEQEWAKYLTWREWHEWKGPGNKPKQPFKRIKAGINLDHIQPKANMKKGGSPREDINKLDNLQIAHIECNNKKGNDEAYQAPKNS